MRQFREQPGAAPCAPALHRALGHAEHLGGVGHRIAEHVDQDERRLLIGHQLAQLGHHVDGRIGGTRRIRQRPARRQAIEHPLIAAGGCRPRRLPPQPVERGVHHDPVQPGRHGRVTAEASCPAKRRDHRVLQRVGGLLRVAKRPDRHRPEPIPVPPEQTPEGIGVPADVPRKQIGIGEPADCTRAPVQPGRDADVQSHVIHPSLPRSGRPPRMQLSVHLPAGVTSRLRRPGQDSNPGKPPLVRSPTRPGSGPATD